MTADVDERLLELVPARRVGTPEEAAACVRFLASEEAAYVTGTDAYGGRRTYRLNLRRGQMSTTVTREELEQRVFAALEEFGAESSEIGPRLDIRVARRGLARHRRARPDRGGRVRGQARSGGPGEREDRSSGRGPGDVRSCREAAASDCTVGPVTPLGVGARTLHERWSRRPLRDRGRARPAATSSRPRSISPSRRCGAPTASRSWRSTAAGEAIADAGWDDGAARRSRSLPRA